jgi:hypothetical protein
MVNHPCVHPKRVNVSELLMAAAHWLFEAKFLPSTHAGDLRFFLPFFFSSNLNVLSELSIKAAMTIHCSNLRH